MYVKKKFNTKGKCKITNLFQWFWNAGIHIMTTLKFVFLL